MKKMCSKCGIEKDFNEFYANKNCKDNISPDCKECLLKKQKQYNARLEIKEHIKQYKKRYREKNKEILLKKKKQYYEDNREYILEQKKQYDARLEVKEHKKQYNKQYNARLEIKEHVKQYIKHRTTNDPFFKCHKNISKMIYEALRSQGTTKTNPTFIKLSYTPEQLVKHLESLWEPWMNWENYGKASNDKRTWQIDHIYPQSKLPYNSMDHPNFFICWALENLRPLEAKENIRKGNKIIDFNIDNFCPFYDTIDIYE